jgi:hypothetical protein
MGPDVRRRAILFAALAVLALAAPARGGSGPARDPTASAPAPAVGPSIFRLAPAGETDVTLAWGMIVDCSEGAPFPLANFRYTAQGALRLVRDGSDSFDLASVVGLLPVWAGHWEGRLGGGPTQAPGGSLELRVVSPHDLRVILREATFDYVLDVDLSGAEAGAGACRLAVSLPLHPGQTVYTSCNSTTNTCMKCSAMRADVTSCTAR